MCVIALCTLTDKIRKMHFAVIDKRGGLYLTVILPNRDRSYFVTENECGNKSFIFLLPILTGCC